MKLLQNQLALVIKKAYDLEEPIELSRPKSEFGDLATNVALVLAKKIGRNPREIATELADALRDVDGVKKVEVAGPGFINVTLTDTALIQSWQNKPHQRFADQTVVVEYSDPNAFKVLHAGHFYTSVVGDAIANLVEKAGGEVKRLNFGGDVGLHVAKTIWAMLKELGGENPDQLSQIEPSERAEWLAKCYVRGTAAYEDDESAKADITELNRRIYQIHADGDTTSPLAKIYWETREWSYDYFKAFYARIGSHFDKFYPESATAERGLKEVKKHIGTVFVESDGAIIFEGEKHGLHNRVFINSQGLPTYETKDIGLVYCKYDDWKFDESIIITGNEQKQYMEVVLKALEQFEPKLAQATTHITHGLVKLAGGVKMSSRKGNFLRAIDVLDYAIAANQSKNQGSDERVALGAIKYAFLKSRIGGDIIYDPEESVSLVGNSGPYLQYAHARACSILAKGGEAGEIKDLTPTERSLVVKLGEYAEVLDQAVTDLTPHLVATYLYELAQEFNRFYETSPIMGDARQVERLAIVKQYADTLADGLTILGIVPLEKM